MSRNGRLQIGFLTSQIEGYIRENIFRSMSRKTNALGMDFISFCGKGLFDKDPEAPMANSVYSLISPHSIDALILYGNILPSNEISRISELVTKIGVPSLVMFAHIPGIPALLLNNSECIKKTIQHLVHDHGCKKIAFVGNHLEHFSAAERYQGYREALKDLDIPFDKSLVFDSRFTSTSGEAAVEEMIAKRGVFPDAIVAANDIIAYGVLKELGRRSIRVPENIIVTGFDNEPESVFASTPLTTVHLPYDDCAEKAVHLIYQLTQGEKIPEITHIKGTLVKRQSCGCLSHPIVRDTKYVRSDVIDPHKDKDRYISIIARKLTSFMHEYHDPSSSLPILIDPCDWVSAFTENLSSPESRQFTTYLSTIIPRAEKKEDLYLLPEMVNIVRKLLLVIFTSDSMKNLIETITGKAIVMIQKSIAQHAAEKTSHLEHIEKIFDEYKSRLDIAVLTPGHFFQALKEIITDCDMNLFSLIFYDKSSGGTMSRLLFFHPSSSVSSVSSVFEGPVFPTRDIFPPETFTKDAATIIIEGIYYQGESVGYMSFDAREVYGQKPNPTAMFNIIRTELNPLMKISFLISELDVKMRSVETNRNSIECCSFFTSTMLLKKVRTSLAESRRHQFDIALLLIEADISGSKQSPTSMHGFLKHKIHNCIRACDELAYCFQKLNPECLCIKISRYAVIMPNCTPDEAETIQTEVIRSLTQSNIPVITSQAYCPVNQTITAAQFIEKAFTGI